MNIKIRQQYMSVGNEYKVFDADGKMIAYADADIIKSRDRLRLYSAGGNLLYKLKAPQKMHFYSYLHMFDTSDAEIGFFQEKAHMPYFRRAYIRIGDQEIKFKCGPIHMKAFLKKNGKWDKKRPIVKGKKKIGRIADTYTAQIDEKKIKLATGVVVAIYYDLLRHNFQH